MDDEPTSYKLKRVNIHNVNFTLIARILRVANNLSNASDALKSLKVPKVESFNVKWLGRLRSF